ncbi:hypothetical protein BaRGS_00012728, partial [Batillaria attramentaria]
MGQVRPLQIFSLELTLSVTVLLDVLVVINEKKLDVGMHGHKNYSFDREKKQKD